MNVNHSTSRTVVKNFISAQHRQKAARLIFSRLRRCGSAFRRSLNRAFCLGLILAILSTSTPAAPQVLVGAATEWRVSFVFWLEASGWAATVRRLFSPQDEEGADPNVEQEDQTQRESQTSLLKIYPANVTFRVGDKAVFAAVANDTQNIPIGGVSFVWSATNSANQPVPMSQQGLFEPSEAGVFTIKVEAIGQQAQATATVLPGVSSDALRTGAGEMKDVSTREDPADIVALPRKASGERYSAHGASSGMPKNTKASSASTSTANAAPAPAPIGCDQCGWNGGNFPSADDPGNGVGAPPGGAQDDGAGSGNFQLSAPLLGLPGRGTDIALALAYNSRLWNKSGSEITYDIDRGWPAPGWSLGFGKLLSMGLEGGSMIVDADGTRHAYKGQIASYSGGSYTTFNGQTIDGTFIDYWHQTGPDGAITYAWSKLPNGTVIVYTAAGPGAIYPTMITDAQGNYIKVTYRDGVGPEIETITDTLGRIVQFHYDSNKLLTAITAPGLATGTTRTLVRLHYKKLTLSYGFSGLTPKVRNSAPWVIDAIYYPGTATGYWFGDADSYSSYGMIAQVRQQRGMTSTATTTTVQGTVGKGTETSESAYNYPLTAISTLKDAPTYTSRTDTWAGIDTPAAVTNYLVQQNAIPRTVTITLPNQTKSIQYSYNYSSLANTHPDKYKDGLVYQDETRDASNNLLSSSTVTWEKGAYDAPRLARTEVTDERQQKTAAEFDYGLVYNQVTEVRDYDYGGVNLLRVTRTQYENSTNYTRLHIFNLIKQVEIFAKDGVTRESRTEYTYDGEVLKETAGVVQHSNAYNPYAPRKWVIPPCEPCDLEIKEYCDPCPPGYWETEFNAATNYRGNVTQVKTYTNAATLTGPIIETRDYDMTGNMVTASSSCCEQTSFTYAKGTQYAYPTLHTRGSATDTTKQVKTSATYSFGTGLALTSKDANARTSTTAYFEETLRPKKATSPTGANVVFAYDDAAMTITETTYLTGTVMAAKNIKYINGLGLVSKEEALTREGGVDYWDVVDTKYDKMGRAWKQTLPYRSGQVAQWAETFYDALGRVTKVKAPDGSESKSFYNEATRPVTASATAGQTTRAVDSWGRERWGRADAQGRLVEVIEPEPEPDPADTTIVKGLVQGAGASAKSLVTKYSYNTLGNLTLVTQGSQQRKFEYDSLGRLTRQKLPEAAAMLNDTGGYLGVGGGGEWSDVFTYDTRGNLTSRVDARGAKTTFAYASDPLNRLQSITYTTGALEQNVAPAPKVTYTYMTTGDLTRPDTVVTTGVSTEDYDYDIYGRVSKLTLTMTGRTAYPMETDYIYDQLSRVKDVRYPAQYGVVNNPRKLVHQDYDVAGRPSALKVDGATYASGLIYNPASQTTEMKVGAANANQITESYDYDVKTGLLTNQQVVRGTDTAATTLLNLTYNYLRTGTTIGRTGQLTKITNHLDRKKDRAYEYDAVGRLTDASGGAPELWTQSYKYDRYGNRTSVVSTGTAANGSAMVRDGLGALTYGVTNNRIITAGWQYDAAGNQTRAKRADGVWQRYEYDAANRLVAVTDDTGATLASYKYGSSNQRLIAYDGEINSPDKTYYIWAGDSVIAEYSESSSAPTTPQWAKSYVYLGARLLATVTPNGAGQSVQYLHPDRLGTRLITNASDTTVQEQVTLPFGTALDAESTGATNRRFTSYDRNPTTKLDYAINRHYDSGQGRFTQVDPLGMGSVTMDDPQTLNLYAYCANDPINQLDHNGLGFFSFLKKLFNWVMKVVAVAVAIFVTFVAIVTHNPGMFIIAGMMWGYVLGGEKVRQFLSITGAALSIYQGKGFLGSVIRGTPPFNPNDGTGVGGLSNFITRLQADEEDVITVTTSCKRNWPLPDGPNCPGASGWLWAISNGLAAIIRETSPAGRAGIWLFGLKYDENSAAYKRSEQAVFYGTMLLPGGGPAKGIKGGTVIVSRWGREGLQAGDWVMKGGVTRWNYLRSFKWQPGLGNQFADFASGRAYEIPASSLKWPRGWGIDGWWKGLFGQRRYVPK